MEVIHWVVGTLMKKVLIIILIVCAEFMFYLFIYFLNVHAFEGNWYIKSYLIIDFI